MAQLPLPYIQLRSKMFSETISAPVPGELKQFIDDLAYRQRVPLAKVVRVFLEAGIQMYKANPQSIVLPSGWMGHKPEKE